MTTALTAREPGVLANGVRYAALHRPGAEVTSVSVWILAGSRHESVPGVAHLLEHVVMQCVPPGRTMRVVDEIEAGGGDANAMTTRDHVVLHARVPAADAAAALRVLAAAAVIGVFDDELVAAERRVVQEELRLAASDPTDIVHDVFFETAYGGHPIGRPVGGTIDGVARLGPADLAAWSRDHVRPATVCVAVCGAMTAAEARAALEDSALAGLPASARGRPPDSSPPVRAGRRDLPIVSDTAAVVIGGPGFALGDRRLLAAGVVFELLAGANVSVLTEELRSRRGLSYDIRGGASGYREAGAWRVAIATAPEHRELVVELATGLVTGVVRRGWSPGQVRMASRRAAGMLRLDAESSLEEVLLYGDHAFVGDSPRYSLATHLAELSELSEREVNEAAEIMTDRLVIATAGGD